MATTKHNHQVIFGRRQSDCPRCAELDAGAQPVSGWGADRKQAELNLAQAIRNHDCTKSRCAVVCTAFQW